ncbi:DUF1102 domain-containing protein [Halocatena pleomorpha]|uniref:DUF1102 domain-containing protein n=1 Tax=Halocatena pleomorpha TaxID=1785090 RepID=UPI00163A6A71|nr:DUF1102 domain-containing protein [Halocatena pleomorpha]
MALVMIVVAASLVTATGAFTSVQAERTAEVNVAGDANAYLGLIPYDGGNGHFAHENSKGELEIKFTKEKETEAGGQGVNPNSVTTFDNVFTIKNQGTQEVNVKVTEGKKDMITFYDSKNGNSLTDGKSVAPGETINVGVEIDASGKTKSSGKITEHITITAKKDGAARTATLPNASSS